MLIGVPKEIKALEYRVGLTPASVRECIKRGHEVWVETHAGDGILATDEEYERAGAKIVSNSAELYTHAGMIVKVKEPSAEECALLREDQIVFAYLHLAADPDQAKGLINSKCVAIAYETVTSDRGGLPLLAPMSEVAGRMSVHVGATLLQIANGGSGVLLGGVAGVKSADVTILGGGVAGTNAAKIAIGMGANVTILEKSLDRIRYLEDIFGLSVNIIYSTTDSIETYVSQADLVIGAVLIPGALTPRLITRDMLKNMRPKAVIVDIAVDQGGCAETSRPTTHDTPTFIIDNVVHYCVSNMPGAVPRTSAHALNNAVLPYALDLADKGWRQALTQNPHLKNGLNVCHGKITHSHVAEGLNLPYTPAEALLS